MLNGNIDKKIKKSDKQLSENAVRQREDGNISCTVNCSLLCVPALACWEGARSAFTVFSFSVALERLNYVPVFHRSLNCIDTIINKQENKHHNLNEEFVSILCGLNLMCISECRTDGVCDVPWLTVRLSLLTVLLVDLNSIRSLLLVG